MYLKLTADYIHDGINGFKQQHVLVIGEQRQIMDFYPAASDELSDCIYYPGLLTPGFVNAHCHLELSHLRGKFPSGTKLIPFLKNVVSTRGDDVELINQAIRDADEEMYGEGIMAVGDISNKKDTIEVKKKSRLKYYTFIEAFDFLQDQLTNSLFESYLEVYEAFENLPKSMVPHAAYSVSPGMFSKIVNLQRDRKSILSIHNQESPHDDLLFLSSSGAYPEFWKSFGFSMDRFKPNGLDSIHYVMDHMKSTEPILWVHNTCSQKDHVRRLMEWNPNSFFVTCPNANLFIENTLPDYLNFIENGAVIAIGTDSLSSNWRLSILSEIQTILKYNAWLDLEEILKWACYNGAKALGMEADLGTLQSQKNPGVNWIRDIYTDGGKVRLKESANIRKII